MSDALLRSRFYIVILLGCFRLVAAASQASADPSFSEESVKSCRIMKGVYDVSYHEQGYAPSTMQVGVSTVYNNGKHHIESVWHPIPNERAPGAIVDLNGLRVGDLLPSRFVLGDGLLTRAFMAVDQRPGTRLDALLKLFVELLPGVERGRVVDEDIVLKYMQKSLDLLVYYRWQKGRDAIGENPWDPLPAGLDAQTQATFAAAVQLAPKQGYYATDRQQDTVAFDQFLTAQCAAYCIQKSLLAKLLFDRIGLPARLVTGSIISFNDQTFTTAGHTWVELRRQDGKTWILDVEQERLAERGTVNDYESDWFWFEGLNRRENQYYPVFLPE